MAPFPVDPEKVREFMDAQAFYDWLAENHDSETEIWIRLYKKNAGIPSIAPAEAIDVCLCWGWIDAIRKGLDETSYLQRYTKRGRKSTWSKINVDNVERLITEGRMTGHGLAHVEAAKADGRWERAYRIKDAEAPADFRAAIDAEPEAKATFEALSSQNRFALIFRLGNIRTEAGRKKKIVDFVAMLKRGETIYPQGRK